MRVSLKSVMELAHYFKSRYFLSMSVALRMAWAKAKGFEYVSIITRVSSDMKRVNKTLVFGHDFEENHKATIAAKNAMHAEHMAGVWKMHSSEQHRLMVYVDLPMRA